MSRCGCKGIRSCLNCEPNIASAEDHIEHDVFLYCINCQAAWPTPAYQNPGDEHTNVPSAVPDTKDDQRLGICTHTQAANALEFPGVFVLPEFISEEEEQALVAAIDESTWKPSQSGRFKQDYGPRVNFKKHKLKCDGFSGLPSFSQPLVDRLASIPILADFKPVEQCHLEYIPDRGSAIDPHIDDTWLWGERLVTVNLLSDSYLFMTPHKIKSERMQQCGDDQERTKAVKIPMARRTLVVIYGEARYDWEHSIPRKAIRARRVALTLRELTPEFREGGEQAEVGQAILETALTFKGTTLD